MKTFGAYPCAKVHPDISSFYAIDLYSGTFASS
jgi:hypothetical protein